MTTLSTSRSIPGGWSPAKVAGTLLLPIVLVNAIGFILPVLGLLKYSLYELTETGAILEVVSLDTWTRVLTDSFYVEMLLRTTLIGVVITVLTLLVSYPIAFFTYRSQGALRSALIVIVISPLLISSVVRTYGWVAILGQDGLINNTLALVGAGPLKLIFNTSGVVIGLVEILMPYMILSLIAGFGRLDPKAEEAARSLGASAARAFFTVTLPLSVPGIALGCLLTFVIGVSAFITPQLLGGGRVFLLATEIYRQAIVTLDWPVAAVLSGLVLLVFGIALAVYARVLRALD